jgi:hypothetical protein
MVEKFKFLIAWLVSILEVALIVSIVFFWNSYSVLFNAHGFMQELIYISLVGSILHLSKKVFKIFIKSITETSKISNEAFGGFIDTMGSRFKDVEKTIDRNEKQNQIRHDIVCRSIDEINYKLDIYDYEKATKEALAQKLDKIWLNKKDSIEKTENKYFQSFIEKIAFNLMLFSCGTIINKLDLKTLQYRLNSTNDEIKQLPLLPFYRVSDSFTNIWSKKFDTIVKCLNNELSLMFDNDNLDLKTINNKWSDIMESYLINIIDCALTSYREAKDEMLSNS